MLDLPWEKFENFFLHPSDFVCKMLLTASNFIKIDTRSVSENERKHITICNRVSYDFSRNCQQNEEAHNSLKLIKLCALLSKYFSVFENSWKFLEYLYEMVCSAKEDERQYYEPYERYPNAGTHQFLYYVVEPFHHSCVLLWT